MSLADLVRRRKRNNMKKKNYDYNEDMSYEETEKAILQIAKDMGVVIARNSLEEEREKRKAKRKKTNKKENEEEIDLGLDIKVGERWLTAVKPDYDELAEDEKILKEYLRGRKTVK